MISVLFFLGLLIMGFVFTLVSFKFISVLLLLENLNVLVLLFSFLVGLGYNNIPYLVFMVVATVEITLALVVLTRLWDFDSIYY
uniref:NADH dehydrogenase subunit 4L n=1 Tax=Enterogyrus malmbergi TaxID=2593014 RepID=A0A6M3R9L1_9PLAT|nr:NADH dehydrogenase subunit 4L [Enterogyrus malmbergi]QJD07091.1 NADH dehydrogenase subunit 4L [Enterogyrus malmbergi]